MTADQATLRPGQAAGPVPVIIDVQEWIMHLPLGPRPGTCVAAACRDLREAVLADGVDAFDNTQLHAYLQSMNASTVILAGIATSHAVLATALTAVRHHYQVHIDPLTVTGVDSEAHAAALRRLEQTAGVTVGPYQGRDLRDS